MFKKYDYYITDLINSKNPNIIKASGKFGNTYVIREGTMSKTDIKNVRDWFCAIVNILADPTYSGMENNLSDKIINDIYNTMNGIFKIDIHDIIK